jgi:hypothetical protein
MKKIFTLFALSVSMLGMAQSWNGSAEMWTAGDGSQQNPYVLESAGNVAYLIQTVNAGETYEGKYFVLSQDVDMCNVETLPMGKFNKYFDTDNYITVDKSTYFLGTLDGKKHTIKNLNIKYVEASDGSAGSTLGGTGFLACSSEKTTVRQLILAGKVTGGEVTGGFVGQMNGGLIEECCNMMTINGESYTGGIAGVVEAGKIVACCNYGEVNGATEIAGIVGQGAETGQVSYCYNTAAVTSVGFGGAGIGGALYDTFAVSNCYSIGKITGNSSPYLGSPQAIVSDKGYSATVDNCYYIADYTGVEDANATAKSETEMKSADMLKLLNGDSDYFTIVESMNNGLPVLKWQTEEAEGVKDVTIDSKLIVAGRTVMASEGTISVYDLCGKCVANGKQATLDAGLYIVTINGTGAAKKLIIK